MQLFCASLLCRGWQTAAWRDAEEEGDVEMAAPVNALSPAKCKLQTKCRPVNSVAAVLGRRKVLAKQD